MTNFHDPTVEASDHLALLKFWHVVAGLYIWEFITNLDFEWSIIRGHRRYRWTIWIYSLARVATLVTVVATLVLLNLDTPAGCQLSQTIALLPAYVALAAASLLLVLRIVAIWRRNLVAVGIATIIWLVNCGFFIEGVARLRYSWVLTGSFCMANNIQTTKATQIIAFVADILLVGIMLAGLFRLDCHRAGALATGRFLWNQGVIWLSIVTVAGVVPTVFACLNLNEPLTQLFRIPWIITMAMVATRMYRGLDDFLSSDNINTSLPPLKGGRRTAVSGSWTPAVRTPTDGITMDANTTQIPTLTSGATRHSYGSKMDSTLDEKSPRLSHGLV